MLDIKNTFTPSKVTIFKPYTKHRTYIGTITDTMDVIRTGRKGRHLKTLEKYLIYKISRNNLHMNDTHTHNHIFQTIHELYDIAAHTTKKDIKARTTTSNEPIQGIHVRLGSATHERNTQVHNNIHTDI
jgi:hypothetical protein